MSVLYHRLCHWLHTSAIVWKRPRTTVATVTGGQRTSRRWLVLLVTLGLSGGVIQWQIGADHARPPELGLSLSEQAFADAVTTSPARPEPEAEASHPVSAAAPATNTVPSSDLAALVAVPAQPITESATPRATPEARISAPRRAVASDVSTDATATLDPSVVTTAAQRRQTTRVRPQRRLVARLAPPRGFSVIAVASRAALIRRRHGSLVMVQSGTILQGWTVQRFAPSGIAVTHHDQRMLLPISREMGQVR